MQNRSKRRWLDIQLIMASLAVTSTVALWNNFARGSQPASTPVVPPPTDPTFTLTYTPTAAATNTAAPTATAGPYIDTNGIVHLPKIHLLLGGKLPAVPVAAAQPAASSSNQGGGNSVSPKGGGGGSNPPPPAANTGSSKPK
jgi:hypothetical protein